LLDDDAAAIHRLLAFVDRQHPVSLHEAYLPLATTATGERADHQADRLSALAPALRSRLCL
jgi:hypothetical protein